MIHAVWPHSRAGRRLAARNRRLADALRTALVEQDELRATVGLLREELRTTREARAGDHAEILRLSDLVATLERRPAGPTDCRYQLHPRDEHRLLHDQADVIARQQREIGQLESTITRMRPRLMEREGR